MKLRNKNTGEIIEFDAILPVKDVSGDSVAHLEYNSLTELNKEWEDYEEPKEYWYLTGIGEIGCIEDVDAKFDKDRKEIGNYFDTREEAEKAVEKLKAWKRLKDKGFKFEKWGMGGEYGNTITFSDYIVCNDETIEDLDTCFGGEE